MCASDFVFLVRGGEGKDVWRQRAGQGSERGNNTVCTKHEEGGGRAVHGRADSAGQPTTRRQADMQAGMVGRHAGRHAGRYRQDRHRQNEIGEARLDRVGTQTDRKGSMLIYIDGTAHRETDSADTQTGSQTEKDAIEKRQTL